MPSRSVKTAGGLLTPTIARPLVVASGRASGVDSGAGLTQPTSMAFIGPNDILVLERSPAG